MLNLDQSLRQLHVTLIILLGGCSTTEKAHIPISFENQAIDLSHYPKEKRDGKTVRIIPWADSQLRNKISVPQAPTSQGTSIIVGLSAHRAWLYQDGKIINIGTVSCGRLGYETPTGTFKVVRKHEKWTSTIYDSSMPYFLRLDPWIFGIHAGQIPSTHNSHGCIRLAPQKAKEFFESTPVHSVVKIIP